MANLHLPRRKILVSCLFAFVLLVVSGLQTNMQFGKLVEAIELSEAQMYGMYGELERAVDDILQSGDASSSEATEWLDEEVSQIAAKYENKIFITGSAIDEITLLPWNVSHRRLKRAYLRHNVAWVEHLAAQSENPRLRQRDAPAIATSWEQFCFQAAKASPLLTFGRFDMRLTRICTEGSN